MVSFLTHPANSAANLGIFQSAFHEYASMDGEIFESGKKKLRIQKYPDTCGRGLKQFLLVCFSSEENRSKTIVSILKDNPNI